MTKVYELPKGRRITADFDENGIIKVTVQAFDSLIGELNYYADKVCDIEQIRAEITAIVINGQVDEHTMFIRTGEQVKQMALDIIDKYREDKE